MSKKWGIEYGALQDFLEEMRRLEADVKGTVEKALVATQDYIADQADKHTEDKYLPAKGEFKSNPSQIKSAIIRDHKVEWELSKQVCSELVIYLNIDAACLEMKFI